MVPEYEDWLPRDKMEMIKRVLGSCMISGYDIKRLLAWVYDLFQEYILSDEQLNELYEFIDPEEKFNDVSKYWYNLEGENLLLCYLR